MYCVKTSLSEAQKTKEFLSSKNYLDSSYAVLKTKNNVFFPVKKEALEALKRQNMSISQKVVKKLEKRDKKKQLKGMFTEKELEGFPSSFDVIGDVIIVEIPKNLEKKEKKIAKFLLKNHKNIKTILKKVAAFKGIFRTRKLKFLAGENTKQALYHENNVVMKMNLEKTYFSPRLAAERKRITKLVKANEEILVMFSGCGPYALVLAKNTKAKTIYAVEINPAAHESAEENIKLNKLGNILLFEGDVKDIVPCLKKRFDRILMPLPKSAEDFLDTAFLAAKKGTIIHFYDFQKEKDIPEAGIEKIDKACRRNNLKYKVLNVVRCGQYAPYEFRICIDFKII